MIDTVGTIVLISIPLFTAFIILVEDKRTQADKAARQSQK